MCGRSPDVWQKPTRLLLLLTLAHFQCLSTNWALFKHRSLPECHGWPKCHKKMSQSSNHIKLEHSCEFTVFKWTPQTPDLNLTEHLGCSGTGHQHHPCTSNKSATTVWCCPVNMDWRAFPATCLSKLWATGVVCFVLSLMQSCLCYQNAPQRHFPLTLIREVLFKKN